MSQDIAVPELSLARLRAITVGVLLVSFLAAMEATVVGTAVPTMVKELGGLELYSWVFTAYMLTMTISVPVWGKLSDLFGRRGVYFTAIGLFVAGSALAGQARSMEELIGWRLLQGLGGGALTPVGQAILGDVYSLEGRARVQVYLTAAFGVASAIGPLVGGYVTEHASWRWVFYLNLPFAIASIAFLGIGLPKLAGSSRRPSLDLGGAILFAVAFSLLLLWLHLGPQWGWMDPRSLGVVTSFVVLFGLFVAVEHRVPEPVIPPGLAGEPMVLGSMIISLLFGMGLYGALMYLPLFYQAVLGKSAAEAGGALTPLLLSWMLVAMISPRLILKVGYRMTIGAGAVCFTASFGVLVAGGTGTTMATAIGAACLMGMAGGLCFAPCMLGAQSVVERNQLGVVSAVVTFFRNVGGAVGVALMGAALASALGGVDSARALSDSSLRPLLDLGLERAFWVGAIVSLLTLPAIALLPLGTALEIRDEAMQRHRQAVAGLHAH